MTYKISTLGCKVNQQESGSIAARFEELGFTPAEKDEAASVCVINSCTVSAVADGKTRQKIRQARAANPGALICVIGCLPQVSREAALGMPEVDIVIGSFDKGRTAELALEALEAKGGHCHPPGAIEPSASAVAAAAISGGRTRAYIKAEDGCDRFCAYCIIPYARGPVRSRPLEETLLEAKSLLEAGYKELALTGVNLALYGTDLPPDAEGAGIDLYRLAKGLCALDAGGEYRVRLGSLEPAVVDARAAARIAGVKGVCPQFHLSLQSGAERTLKAMGRPYTPDDFEGIVRVLRETDPLFSITTDVITGFPGETDADFEESLAFVKRTGFARAHVFKYSLRPGTRAAEMPDQVPEDVKRERSRLMIEAAEEGSARFRADNLGKTRRTLIYGPDKSGRFIRGLTDNGIDVRIPVREYAAAGDLLPNHFEHIVLNAAIL